MTDRTHSERAGSPPIDCDRFDALLPDWLEGTLPASARSEFEAHRTSCARCRALADDLVAISRDAAALPPIEPPRDLWAGIAARIEAPVVPLGRTGEHSTAGTVTTPLRVERGTTTVRRDGSGRTHLTRRWLAAAAGVLVAVSVGSTYAVMRMAGRGTSPIVASGSPTAPTPASPAVPAAAPVVVATIPDSEASTAQETAVARRGAAARIVQSRRDAARLAADEGDAYGPVVTTYDREIASLRAALRHRTDLDSSTVVVLERSLRIIDDAIAQSRRALANDPNSRLLGDQLTRALDQKVELLRTAVLLPSHS